MPPNAQKTLEELGPLFVPPQEADRFWILIAILAATVIAVALIALVRGRLPDALSYSGLLLFPIFAYVLGDLHLLEESKQVQFCGSCHETMSPLVEAMRTDGDHLSGFHFRRGAVPHQNACYRCHSGYGIWGGFRAKEAGVQHMLNTIRGSYEFPLHLAAPLDISSCRDCHAQAVPFREAEAHRDPDIQQLLLSGELGCTGACHPTAHPEAALRGAVAWQASR